MAGTDFSHLTNDELIKGIKALDLPDYIRSKAYGIDVRETLAQMTEMTIQLGVNMGLSPDEALKWARKLQESVSQSEFDSWVATLLDGGPSIFMNTLSELQSTYPNGAAGVALVRETDPARIYVWNGSAWEDFGAYQGIEVKDGTITKEKLADTYLEIDRKYKNLFDKDTVLKGYFVNATNGAVQTNASYSVAEIPIVGGRTYIKNSNPTGAWYDGNGAFISGVAFNEPQPMTAPINARIAKVSARNSELGSFIFVEGETLPEFYVPFHEEIGNKVLTNTYRNIEINNIKDVKEIVHPILQSGGTIDLWGDSRTHGTGGSGFAATGDLIPGTDVRQSPNSYSWANELRDLLSSKYGVTVNNWGQSGKNTNHFVNQMATLTDLKPDLIIIALGTNDRHNVASVEVTKSNLRQMIDLANSKGIKVVLMSMPPTTPEDDNNPIRNFGMYDLDRAIREVSYEYSQGYIDGYGGTMTYCDYRDVNSDILLNSDGLHENDNGYRVVYHTVAKSLGVNWIKDGVTK